MHGRSQAITSCRSAEKGQSLLGWRNALKDWAVLLPTFKIFRWSPEIFRVQCLHVGKGKMNPHIFSSPAQLFVIWFNLGRLLQHHPHFGGYRGSGWEKCNNFFSKSDFFASNFHLSLVGLPGDSQRGLSFLRVIQHSGMCCPIICPEQHYRKGIHQLTPSSAFSSEGCVADDES